MVTKLLFIQKKYLFREYVISDEAIESFIQTIRSETCSLNSFGTIFVLVEENRQNKCKITV